MVKESNISFIPKKPIAKRAEKRSRPISISFFVSFSVFFLTLGAYGGLYLYKVDLGNRIEDKKVELEDEKKRLDPERTIEEAELLRAQIENAQSVVGAHIAPTRVLSLLEELTLASVVFNSLEFSLEEAQGVASVAGGQPAVETVTLQLRGVAPSYASLAYQADVLRNEMLTGARVQSFAVENPELTDGGNIAFSVKVVLPLSALAYELVAQDTESTSDTDVDDVVSPEVSTTTESVNQ